MLSFVCFRIVWSFFCLCERVPCWKQSCPCLKLLKVSRLLCFGSTTRRRFFFELWIRKERDGEKCLFLFVSPTVVHTWRGGKNNPLALHVAICCTALKGPLWSDPICGWPSHWQRAIGRSLKCRIREEVPERSAKLLFWYHIMLYAHLSHILTCSDALTTHCRCRRLYYFVRRSSLMGSMIANLGLQKSRRNESRNGNGRWKWTVLSASSVCSSMSLFMAKEPKVTTMALSDVVALLTPNKESAEL